MSATSDLNHICECIPRLTYTATKCSFQMSHSKTTTSFFSAWLEPILEYLSKHENAVIQPFVDGIGQWDIAYSGPNDIFKGATTWDLRCVTVLISNEYNADLRRL